MSTTPVDPTNNGTTRIGFLAPGLSEGGGENHMLFLADALAAYPPTAPITWQGCASLDTQANADPIIAGAIGALMPVTYGEAAAQTLAARCDVLLVWAVYPLAYLKQFAPSCRMVFIAHRGETWNATTMRWLSAADRIVAVSSIAAAAIPSQSSGVPISTIPNAIDPARLTTSRTRASVRAGWGVPASAKVAGFVGRLAAEKYPGIMLDLSDAINSSAWWSVLVGTGPLASSLTSRVASGGPSSLNSTGYPNVVLPGEDGDIAGAILAMDYVVVPSALESFNYVIAQAWALGVPVVCSDVGVAHSNPSYASVVAGSPTGSAFAQALLAADANPGGTGSRTTAAKQFATSNLALAPFGQAWASLINGLFS